MQRGIFIHRAIKSHLLTKPHKNFVHGTEVSPRGKDKKGKDIFMQISGSVWRCLCFGILCKLKTFFYCSPLPFKCAIKAHVLLE